MASMQAMGALNDGFALGLLEAWCQLQTIREQILLVVYDEAMPEYLLPDYTWKACAFALVLGRVARDHPQLHRPFQATVSDPARSDTDFSVSNPAMATLPLFQMLQRAASGPQQITLSSGARPWLVDMIMP
jgi:hypothetical protein